HRLPARARGACDRRGSSSEVVESTERTSHGLEARVTGAPQARAGRPMSRGSQTGRSVMSGITSHHLLARLLTITAGSDAGWGDDDLGDILAHQLRMPLLAASGGPPAPGATSRSGSGSQVSFVTFSDALLDPTPELP